MSLISFSPHSSICLIFSHFVFPSSTRFVFIMGTSVALSINSLLCAGSTRCSLLRKVVWRSLQLFIIGVFIINPNYCQGPCEWHTSLMLTTTTQTIYADDYKTMFFISVPYCGLVRLFLPFFTCLCLPACLCAHLSFSSTPQYLGTTCGSQVCCSAWPGHT